ncbi:MAG: hypothetical protein GF317_16880 [Candidatus Lokiarchaeota archaeon]|nr:hypothetical protein [Candidatus Lokiarchaeota archaeon]MBD3201193.1 hypothetical protein [Candidatus Lokiarchaeota archaeon]
MDAFMKPDLSNLKEKLNFINISSDYMSIFEWKPPRSFKSYVLDLNIVKEHATNDIFFHIHKGNSKIVHIRKNNLIYTAGAGNGVQFQLLEAILEKIDEKFNETYEVDVILSFENASSNIFKNFASTVEDLLQNIDKLDLIKPINAYCRVCKKVLPIYVKKSFIENAEDFPVPLVYTHAGHAILVFIDRNFDVRGVELVNVSG